MAAATTIIAGGSALLGAYQSSKARKQGARQFRDQQAMQQQMQQDASARADKFGDLAEEQFKNIPTYKTPQEFLQAMDLASGAFESGTSRLQTLQKEMEDRRRAPLSGYAEQKLTEGLQRTEQNIARLSKVGGTRDVAGLVKTLSGQASQTGALAEAEMEKQEQEYLNFLPRAMQMEQGLSAQLQGAFQTLGGQRGMEQQSEMAKQQQLFNLYSQAATGQAQFGQQVALSGMQNQAMFGAAQLQAGAQQGAAMTTAGLNALSSMAQAGAFNKDTNNSSEPFRFFNYPK